MKLLDANILIYAYNSSSKFHNQVLTWLTETLETKQLVGLPWISVIAFIRISTNRRAVEIPLSPEEAVQIISELLAVPNVIPVEASESHWEVLAKLLLENQICGPLTTDAHLAALSIEHGATLCSTDRDFARFKGFNWFNPAE